MAGEAREFFLVARMGECERLIALVLVREIVPAMELAQAPGASGLCCGMANVRGEVVPVFAPTRGMSEPLATQLIVIAQGRTGASIGLLVDDVLDIVELAREDVSEHPVGGGRVARSANVAGKLLSVLTLDEVTHAA